MRTKALLMSVCLLMAGLALAADEKSADSAETSKSLFFATYKESTDQVEVIVGSLIAGVAEHEKYIPLQFAVGVAEKSPELEVTPDRFQLIDSKGNIFNAVAEYDVAREAEVLQYARAFNKQNPLQTAFEFATNIERVMSDFYPLEGGKFYVVSHVGQDSFLTDLLFFPNPGDTLGDVLTLQFLTPGMDEAVELRFEVPLKHKKTKKHKKKLEKQKAEADSE